MSFQSLKFLLKIHYILLFVFGWMLMDGHELYTKYQRSFLNVTFSKFIVDLAQLCNGIQTPDPVKALDFQKHRVP